MSMVAKQDIDAEVYWQRNAEMLEAEERVEDLEERLEWWRTELERRQRKLGRIAGA